MDYKKYGTWCLAGSEYFPAGAVSVQEPFAPLAILTRTDPLWSRGAYRIDSLLQLNQDNPAALLPTQTLQKPDILERFVNQNGATVLNTAFPHCWDVLNKPMIPSGRLRRIVLAGLGDVGGAVLTGLMLLSDEIEEISLFDPNKALCRRYEIEMNQILPLGGRRPVVTVCPEDRLFDCELFLFTATKGVPALGQEQQDVRMAQFQANRRIAELYARQAREAGFRGIFCQISDPVDHLCRAVFLAGNRDAQGHLDFSGLLPEQIRGFGLGVMAARAGYCARDLAIPSEDIRVYGPHGAGLVAANAPLAKYDPALSLQLTDMTREINLKVRALGYKPYIAPGLSSAAISILAMIRGLPHWSAVPLGGVYFGCQNQMDKLGISILREPLHPELYRRICDAYRELKEFNYGG